MKALKPGDIVAVTKLDRLGGRSRPVVIETNADALGRSGNERDDWLR
jgi:hypothetical protein